MKFVGLISGGKDSIYSIMNCLTNGHELVACAHLAPPLSSTNNDKDEESYMFQTAGSECISTMVTECIGVPFVVRNCTGTSQDTSLHYTSSSSPSHNNDEVEDLYQLLLDVKEQFPSIQAVSSGAILSTYQRTRIENVCDRLGYTSLGYLWRAATQNDLLESMLRDKVEAVLVKVAAPPGLVPQKHLNQSLTTLLPLFQRLESKYKFHICGEGGEYETLVLDCPLFATKRLVLTKVQIVEDTSGVGVLVIHNCTTVDKPLTTTTTTTAAITTTMPTTIALALPKETNESVPKNCSILQRRRRQPRLCHLPHVKILSGGLAHVSEILCPVTVRVSSSSSSEEDAAVQEAKSILQVLQQTLSTIVWKDGSSRSRSSVGATAHDVVLVHLYLSDITHFVKINSHYKDFFGTLLPPSRSCVSVGRTLPGGRRVMMDCLIQRGSGAYMRCNNNDNNNNNMFVQQNQTNPCHVLRSVLHVQSISNWAPVCVGPYSQANTIRSSIVFLAGQIGLVPATMKLNTDGGWKHQLMQCWKNAASVLDSLHSATLDTVIGGVVYIRSDIVLLPDDDDNDDNNNNNNKECTSSVNHDVWMQAEQICHKLLNENGGIPAGYIDGTATATNNESLYDGFEDYDTWKECMGDDITKQDDKVVVPLLMIAVPQMPMGAACEVELICASSRASSCLELCTSDTVDHSNMDSMMPSDEASSNMCWDLGYDGTIDPNVGTTAKQDNVQLQSMVRYVGNGCAAVMTILASFLIDSTTPTTTIHTELLMQNMIRAAIWSLETNTGLDKEYMLHVRLFYSTTTTGDDDAILLRGALQSAIYSSWTTTNDTTAAAPACSIVPVNAMCFTPQVKNEAHMPLFAMQIITTNLIHMETEMWIHHNR